MADFSPAAQAVLTAYHQEAIDYIEEWGSFRHKRGIAAALRAAADQAEDLQVPCSYAGESYQTYDKGLLAAAEHLRTIAAELEAP
jgi:hypothetical protein